MNTLQETNKIEIKRLAKLLKAGIEEEKYIIYKEEKNNKVYSSNFNELKNELAKYNIEFGKVPNKRIYFYLKKL